LGAFNGLTKLTELLIEISKIKPGTFENMISLKKLVLRYNRIDHLNSDVFSGLVNIKTIDLTANKLQFLYPDTFLGLPKLQYLYLSINRGLQIPTDRNFTNSHFLSHLDISNCNVNSVSVEMFTNVSALNVLDLRYNNLWTVDVNIVRALPEHSKVYLYGNLLQCNSQLKEVWRWCEHRNIRTAYDGLNEVGVSECDTQKEVMGIWWGLLEKWQCFQGNIKYYGDYKI
jgi:Leucine-rich repeat (LRR) protein